MHAAYNLTRWLGIENYTGYYALGHRVELLVNTVGGKFAYRNSDRFTPYVAAGFGLGSLRAYDFGEYGYVIRVSGGVDLPLNESVSFRVDAGPMGFGRFISGRNLGGWRSSLNVSTGFVFTLGR